MQEVVVEKLGVNPALPADAFAPPDDTQALVDAHQKQESESDQ